MYAFSIKTARYFLDTLKLMVILWLKMKILNKTSAVMVFSCR